jgi:uncharacterized membrane protein (DUF485 family)
MDLSEKYETGTKAWDIAIDNSEDSLFAMKLLTQALILLFVGILYILAAFLQQALGTVLISILSANIAVGVGSLVFIIAILYIVYMSIKFYKNRRRSWKRTRDATENTKLSDFESNDGAKESQDAEEFEKELN